MATPDNQFELDPGSRAPHHARREVTLCLESVAQLFDEVLLPKAEASELAAQATKNLVRAEMPDYEVPVWARQPGADAVEAVTASLAKYEHNPAPAVASEAIAPVVNLAARQEEEQDRLARLQAANEALQQALKPAA